MSLDTLRKSNSLDKLLGAVQAENAPQEKKSYVDERLWKPELDKTGNGYAVIRFLPAIEGETLDSHWRAGRHGEGGEEEVHHKEPGADPWPNEGLLSVRGQLSGPFRALQGSLREAVQGGGAAEGHGRDRGAEARAGQAGG